MCEDIFPQRALEECFSRFIRTIQIVLHDLRRSLFRIPICIRMEKPTDVQRYNHQTKELVRNNWNSDWNAGGTQFSSFEFQEFFFKSGINWAPSTPTYAQSNGLAEVTFKSIY